jgi:hypothetical protein
MMTGEDRLPVLQTGRWLIRLSCGSSRMERDAPYLLMASLLIVMVVGGLLKLLIEDLQTFLRRRLGAGWGLVCSRTASSGPSRPGRGRRPVRTNRVLRVRLRGDAKLLPVCAIVLSLLGVLTIVAALAGPGRIALNPGASENAAGWGGSSSGNVAHEARKTTALVLVASSGTCLLGCAAGHVALRRRAGLKGCSRWAFRIGAPAAFVGLLLSAGTALTEALARSGAAKASREIPASQADASTSSRLSDTAYSSVRDATGGRIPLWPEHPRPRPVSIRTVPSAVVADFPDKLRGFATVQKVPVKNAKTCLIHLKSCHWTPPWGGLSWGGQERSDVESLAELLKIQYYYVNKGQHAVYLLLKHIAQRYDLWEVYSEGLGEGDSPRSLVRRGVSYRMYVLACLGLQGVTADPEGDRRARMRAEWDARLQFIPGGEVILAQEWPVQLLPGEPAANPYSYDREEINFHNYREDYVLRRAVAAGKPVAVVVYGTWHTWQDNVKRWNQEHPEHPVCLIEVLPY